ncbi:MAG: glycosyltransferase family 2 protein [Nitrospirae bacterium]|nr:glycosyltransferase family 2 protein [Nitrospirota bacterium]
MPRTLSIIIPAFNEESSIEEVIRRVERVDIAFLGVEKQIVVVDDGSTDGTVSKVRCSGRVSVVRHPHRRGKGSAIRTGLAHATGDLVLIQDADLEYDPSDYPCLLDPMLKGAARVVYGSRFLLRRRPEGMRLAFLGANRILTLLANVLYGGRLTDMTTCYKLFRTEDLRAMDIEAEGFEFCPEATAKLKRAGVDIMEVPVSYQARQSKGGKKLRWWDGLAVVKSLFEWRFRRVASIARA